MYTREVTSPPEHIIADGKPVFGLFSAPFDALDIRGVKCPFIDIPLPPFITNLRIRSNLSYMFATDDFIGMVDVFDSKIFGFMEVIVWEQKTGKKYAYRHAIGPHRHIVPKSMQNAVCVSLNAHRYVRINWSTKQKRLSVLCNMRGDSVRASLSAAFTVDFTDEHFAQTATVMPSPLARRCLAIALFTGTQKGSLSILPSKRAAKNASASANNGLGGATLGSGAANDNKATRSGTANDKTANTIDKSGGTHANTAAATTAGANIAPNVQTDTKTGVALLDIRRAYYPLRTKASFLTGLGMINGKQVSFRLQISNIDAADTHKYNANFLFVDGDMTPLPPIMLTRPKGINGTWIIQDTENMVDLAFHPVSDTLRSVSALIVRTDYHTIYGTFDGVIVSKNGESFALKRFSGIGKKILLRC